MKKRIALSLAVFLLMGLTLQANAATNSAGALYDCVIAVGSDSRGVIVSVEANATAVADEIGCRDIVLVEKKDGKVTRTINIPSGSASNSYTYGDAYLYTGALEGRTYYASCTFYAKYGNTEKTAGGSTSGMVYYK